MHLVLIVFILTLCGMSIGVYLKKKIRKACKRIQSKNYCWIELVFTSTAPPFGKVPLAKAKSRLMRLPGFLPRLALRWGIVQSRAGEWQKVLGSSDNAEVIYWRTLTESMGSQQTANIVTSPAWEGPRFLVALSQVGPQRTANSLQVTYDLCLTCAQESLAHVGQQTWPWILGAQENGGDSSETCAFDLKE
ncbi:hypothetical protein U0070_018848 [Myodes glareolus]|uniref:Secreted protein n=1 Tax=Myodes glareolus TaxID=447135 RepID=A0AAW0JUE0_MYOGA